MSKGVFYGENKKNVKKVLTTRVKMTFSKRRCWQIKEIIKTIL